MFLKLTDQDGNLIYVNSTYVPTFYKHVSGTEMILKLPDSGITLLLKETPEQIMSMLSTDDIAIVENINNEPHFIPLD